MTYTHTSTNYFFLFLIIILDHMDLNFHSSFYKIRDEFVRSYSINFKVSHHFFSFKKNWIKNNCNGLVCPVDSDWVSKKKDGIDHDVEIIGLLLLYLSVDL